MIPNFKIQLPWVHELTIKQAALLPYIEFRDSPDLPEEPYSEITKWKEKTELEVKEIILPPSLKTAPRWSNNPGKITTSLDWMDYLRMEPDNRQLILSNPNYSVFVFFMISKGSRKALGQRPGTEMFVINEVIYRKMTYRSIFDKEGWVETKPKSRYPRNPRRRRPRNRPTRWQLQKMEKPIQFKTESSLSFFLMKSQAANSEPRKSHLLGAMAQHLFKEKDEIKESVL